MMYQTCQYNKSNIVKYLNNVMVSCKNNIQLKDIIPWVYRTIKIFDINSENIQTNINTVLFNLISLNEHHICFNDEKIIKLIKVLLSCENFEQLNSSLSFVLKVLDKQIFCPTCIKVVFNIFDYIYKQLLHNQIKKGVYINGD